MFPGCDAQYRQEFNEFLVTCPDCGAKTRVPNQPGRYACRGSVWDDQSGPVSCPRRYYLDYLKVMAAGEARL